MSCREPQGEKVCTLDVKAKKVGSWIKPPEGTYKGEEGPPPTSKEIEDWRPIKNAL